MTKQTLAITAADLANLVRPVLPFAGTSDDLPVLTGVDIHVRDGYLVAMSTDRYRLACKRLRTNVEAFDALISARDLRSILSLFKATRRGNPAMTLTVDGTKLTVANHGTLPVDALFSDAMLTFNLLDGKFPDLSVLFTKALERPRAETSHVGLNAHLLAAWRLSADDRRGEMFVQIGASNEAIIVSIGEDFVGMQMPLQIRDGSKPADLTWWAGSASLEPKPTPRKRAAKKPSAA